MLVKKEANNDIIFDISGPRANAIFAVQYLENENFLGREKARALLRDRNSSYEKIIGELAYHCDLFGIKLIHDLSDDTLEEVEKIISQRKQQDAKKALMEINNSRMKVELQSLNFNI